ncbi:hypothetical protein BX667DRAFT_349762 [Coemansia mojavensis]|nr:hypothetical protein BX667DRAFT_349762 [Coemansia mojavensis]
MFFTQMLFAQKRRQKFGDPNLPRMDRIPRARFRGMSKRQLCWTVIIVTIPFIVVSGEIVYKRRKYPLEIKQSCFVLLFALRTFVVVLGEGKRRRLMEGGIDSSYLLDNIASSRSWKFAKHSSQDEQRREDE